MGLNAICTNIHPLTNKYYKRVFCAFTALKFANKFEINNEIIISYITIIINCK